MAGFAIENVLTGKVKTFHWHDVDKLPRDGSVTLLDVRTPGERAMGQYRGIPPHSLGRAAFPLAGAAPGKTGVYPLSQRPAQLYSVPDALRIWL